MRPKLATVHAARTGFHATTRFLISSHPPPQANVVACNVVECFVLGRDQFTKVVGHYKKAMHEKVREGL